MKKLYSLKEVVTNLETFPNERYKRVNDEKFIVFRGHFGELMFKIEGTKFARVLPYFNYTQDLFFKLE